MISPSREARYVEVVEPDQVDTIVAQWNRERPSIDVSGMSVIGRLVRVNTLIRGRLDETFARHDLESWEFDVLATLLRNGAPHQLTPGQLLDSMMVTSGAMTNRIDRLEARGFVRRVKNPDDGRQVLVTLTIEGIAKVDAALVDHAANELDLLASLDVDQRERLIELFRLLEDSVARSRTS